MFNKLTLLYSKIYYKEENYLKVKTVVFKYITPPIVKVKYINIFLYSHIFMFLCSELLVIYCLYNLAYSLSYSSTGFISPVSCILILNQYKSSFNTCIILFIKFVIYNNTIHKLFLKSKKTIKVILSSITRIRLIIYIEDPKEAVNIIGVYT